MASFLVNDLHRTYTRAVTLRALVPVRFLSRISKVNDPDGIRTHVPTVKG